MDNANLKNKNPFPGLRPFYAGEEELFFGREIHTEQLLRRLSNTNFLAITGQPGSGKSSLVNCGLLPALEDDFKLKNGTKWKPILFKPGKNPIDNLAREIAKKDVLFEESGMEEIFLPLIKKALRNSASGLAEAFKHSNISTKYRYLIVIDQFEELFRYEQICTATKKNETADFINLLLEATQQSDIPIYLIITLRHDYLGECTRFQGLPELINDGQYLIPRMAEEELRFAIQEPIIQSNHEITEALVERIIIDFKQTPDNLPLLQHALWQTWEYWKQSDTPDKPIDISDYEAIGTLTNSIEIHAEKLFNSLDNENKKIICKKTFQLLFEKISDEKYNKRLCRLKHIIDVTKSEFDEINDVISVFRQESSLFIIPDINTPLDENSVIDIGTENIIYYWPRLKEWIDEEKQSAHIFLELVNSQQTFNKGESSLWRGDELNQAIDWRNTKSPDKTWAVRYSNEFDKAMNFLDKSIKNQELERKKESKLQKSRIVTITLIVATVISIFFALLALINQREAVKQRERAEINYKDAQSKNLIFLARDIVERDPTIAIRLAQKAKELYPSEMVDNTIRQIYYGNNFYKNIVHVLRQINAFDVSRSGEYILAAIGKNARIWDLSGNTVQTLSDHTKDILDVEFSNDENYILTAGKDNKVILWGTNGNKILAFNSHSERVTSVAFSQNSKMFLSASWDGKVFIRKLAGEIITEIHQKDKRINCAVFSPDGKKVLTANSDNSATLWSISGKLLAKFQGHKKEVVSVAFSPLNDGKLLTTSKDKTIKLWNEDGKLLQTFKGHSYTVDCAQFTKDGKMIVSGSADNSARLWDCDGNELQVFKGHTDRVVDINFFPDSKYLFTASTDGTIKLWNLLRNKFFLFSGPKDEISAVSITMNTSKSKQGFFKFYILAASWDNTVRLWDIWGNEVGVIKGHKASINSAVFSSKGDFILTGADDNTARIWNLNGKELTQFTGHSKPVLSVAFSPNSEYVLTGSMDNTVKLWKVDGKLLKTFKGHRDVVTSVIFSPDGSKILTGSKDRTARLWSRDGKLLRVFKGHTAPIASVAFSSDGKFILTGSWDNTARLWDISKYKSRVFRGHDYYVNSVAFSPDDKMILTGSLDKTARLWDLEGKVLQIFKGHKDYVRTATFAPDGKFVLTGSADNTVRLWEIQPMTDSFFDTGDIEDLSISQMLKYNIIDYDDLIEMQNHKYLVDGAKYFLENSIEDNEVEIKITKAKRAIKIINRALEIAKSKEAKLLKGETLGYISRCYLYKNNFNKVISYGENAITIDSSLLWINTNLIIAYYLTGKKDAARNLYEKLRNTDYNADYTYGERIEDLIKELSENQLTNENKTILEKFIARY